MRRLARPSTVFFRRLRFLSNGTGSFPAVEEGLGPSETWSHVLTGGGAPARIFSTENAVLVDFSRTVFHKLHISGL